MTTNTVPFGPEVAARPASQGGGDLGAARRLSNALDCPHVSIARMTNVLLNHDPRAFEIKLESHFPQPSGQHGVTEIDLPPA
jgi:hypothetical protein